ncbi:MAG TPA: hypothetical protein VF401_03985 [Candidatus Saccharimonadales bacterium]
MTISTFDNPEIQITAVAFRTNPGDQRFESFPRRMVCDGREVNFMEQGMRYLVHRGQQLIKLFDVSDGQTQYRLRQDSDNHWSLVNMKALVA